MTKLLRLGIGCAVSIALTFVLSPARTLFADDFNWNVANGDFNTGTNWNPTGPPTQSDNAFINNGGTATLSTGLGDAAVFEIGSAAGQSGAIVINGGDFQAASVIHVGEVGTGNATVSSGAFRAKFDSGISMFIGGENGGGTGTLTVSGASTFVQVGDDVGIGRTGNGTLNMQGGRMTGVFTFLGKFGTGVWNHSGGVFDQAGGDIEIGDGGRPDQAGTPGPRNGTINLSGGVIHGAGHVALGNRNGTGTVNVSGGALDVTGDSNGTGTIFVGRGMDWAGMPGAGGPVALRVTGDDSIVVANGGFSMNVDNVASSSTLIANITGATHTPIKVVGDALIANGAFKVELTGYTPVLGNTWTILEAGADISAESTSVDALVSAGGFPLLNHVAGSAVGTLMGTFLSEDFSQAPLSPGLAWDVDYVGNSVLLKIIAAGIAGDYNDNGTVDAADYVVWRNAGPTDVLPNDPTSGIVDDSDYTVWKSHFGQSLVPAAGAGLGGATVPEPVGVTLLLAALITTGLVRFRPDRIRN